MTFISKKQLAKEAVETRATIDTLIEQRDSARNALTDVLEATELNAAITGRTPTPEWWLTLDEDPILRTVTAIDLDKLKSIVAQRSQQHANEVEGYQRALDVAYQSSGDRAREAAEKASAATRITVTESILTLVLDALQIRGYRATADTDLFAGILADVNARNGHTPALKYDTARFEADLRTTLEARQNEKQATQTEATRAKVEALTNPDSKQRLLGDFGLDIDGPSFGAAHTIRPASPAVAEAFAATGVVYNEADALAHINTDAKPTKKKKVDTRRGSK